MARLPELPTAKGRALALAAVVAALALVSSTGWMHGRLMGYFSTVEDFIREHPELGLFVFVAFAAASAMLAFVSSAVIVPVGVLVWGEAAAAGLLWAGWIVGGACSFTLSRYLGRPVVRALSSGSLLAAYERRLSERTPFGLVLLLQFALPSELPGYLLGLARYSFAKYLAALALAELPYALGTVYLGANFVERRTVPLIVVGVAGAALSACAMWALRRRVLGRSPS